MGYTESFDPLPEVNPLPDFGAQRMGNQSCDQHKVSGRQVQKDFASGMQAFDFQSDEIARVEVALGRLAPFARALVYANQTHLDYLPPTLKKDLGFEYSIAMSPRHLFLHTKGPKGEGHAKRVYTAVAIDRQSLELSVVVHKKIEYKPVFYQDLFSEIEIAGRLQGTPHVVDPPMACFDYETRSGGRRLALYEPAYETSLDRLCDKTRERLLPIFRNIAEGLKALHSKGYLHGDLTVGNVFIEGDSAFLGDLGAAQEIGGAKSQGTLSVRPPEEFFADHKALQTAEGDIWSFGLLVHHSFANDYPPFVNHIWLPRLKNEWAKNLQPQALTEQEIETGLFKGWRMKGDADQRLQDLVVRCLDLDPSNRPDAGELIALLQ